jgi:hypothetical protein
LLKRSRARKGAVSSGTPKFMKNRISSRNIDFVESGFSMAFEMALTAPTAGRPPTEPQTQVRGLPTRPEGNQLISQPAPLETRPNPPPPPRRPAPALRGPQARQGRDEAHRDAAGLPLAGPRAGHLLRDTTGWTPRSPAIDSAAPFGQRQGGSVPTARPVARNGPRIARRALARQGRNTKARGSGGVWPPARTPRQDNREHSRAASPVQLTARRSSSPLPTIQSP